MIEKAGIEEMKKVIVIGCPGGGKSTFARALHERTGFPLFHLDLMYWNADRTIVAKSVFRKRVLDAMAQEVWIIDGNYGSTMELRLQACDTVFFLDYPLEGCLEGVKARRGKARTDMPWIEAEDEEDAEFLSFIQSYNTESRPVVLELLKKYTDKAVYVFESRSAANAFLESV